MSDMHGDQYDDDEDGDDDNSRGDNDGGDDDDGDGGDNGDYDGGGGDDDVGNGEWMVMMMIIMNACMMGLYVHVCPNNHLPFVYSKAKLLLKKKRYQEQQLERTDNQLDNLEKMVSHYQSYLYPSPPPPPPPPSPACPSHPP